MSPLHLLQIEVLIVDDEVQTWELLSEFCSVYGYDVETDNDGRADRAAVTRASKKCGIVTADLLRSGVDGLRC